MVKEEVGCRNPLASKKSHHGWKNSSFVLVTSKTYLAIFIISNIPYFPTPTYKKAFSSCLTS